MGAANYVTVAMQLINEDGGNVDNAHLHFEPTDLVWIQNGNIVTPLRSVDLYASGGSGNTQEVALFGMDVPSVSTGWNWVMTGEVNGYSIPRRKLVVLLAAGAQQNLADLLAAGTLF